LKFLKKKSEKSGKYRPKNMDVTNIKIIKKGRAGKRWKAFKKFQAFKKVLVIKKRN
jgi:hypothetical protein